MRKKDLTGARRAAKEGPGRKRTLLKGKRSRNIARGRRDAAEPRGTSVIPQEYVARPEVSAPRPPAFHIVGIGASAGGLEACSQLLRALPENVKFAMVVVQHLAPGHESFLPTLLATTTPLSVEPAADRTKVEPGRVYVIPPNAHLEIQEGVLRLVPRPTDHTQYMPVDHFLRSLAEYAQARAIGVVLSGTASDGAEGLREIKASDGIAIAQDPLTAKYDGMPRAAANTGVVDLVLSPEEIAKELVRISEHTLLAVGPVGKGHAVEEAGPEVVPDEHHMARIFSILRKISGVDFSQYKLPTIRRRLHRRMVLHKIENIDQYVRFLQGNPSEAQSLYQDILIHVTRFFRDPESFQCLTNKVFAKIMEDRDPDTPVRIWVPGCSTGEEAYSVAIALLEFLGNKAGGTAGHIFATDVSEAAIERARSGIFPENISADLSPDRLRRFFARIDGNYRITKQVRDMCVFARQDLTRDPRSPSST